MTKGNSKKPTEKQRAQWAAERDAKVERAKELLVQGLRRLETDAGWLEMLGAMARWGKLSPARLSFGNQLLVAAQAPECEAVATFKGWQAVGRQVQAGAKALFIMRPAPFKLRDADAGAATEMRLDDPKSNAETPVRVWFKPMAVFDLRQTEGEPLANPYTSLGDCAEQAGFERAWDKLAEAAVRLGLCSSVRAAAPGERPGVNGWCELDTRRVVVVTEGRTRAAALRTLCHELGHAILHAGEGDHHARPEMEVEAESVAYVVCTALGLDAGERSFRYAAIWAGRSATDKDAARLVLQSGERISRAARTILGALYGEEQADEEGSEAA